MVCLWPEEGHGEEAPAAKQSSLHFLQGQRLFRCIGQEICKSHDLGVCNCGDLSLCCGALAADDCGGGELALGLLAMLSLSLSLCVCVCVLQIYVDADDPMVHNMHVHTHTHPHHRFLLLFRPQWRRTASR